MATATNPLEGIQQDKDGNYFVVVDAGDGGATQVFKGKTVPELLVALTKAQQNATKRIREQNLRLKIENTPDPATPPPTFAPHTPTTDELWKLTEDLKNPTTAHAAMRRAIAWELGADPATIRESIQRAEFDRRRAENYAAGKEFMAAHPEFVPCDENEQAVYGYLEKRGLATNSRKNLEIAFEALKTGLVLRAPQQHATPAPAQQAAEIPPAPTRPRGSSTALSPRQSSAVPPSTTQPRTGRLTEAEINAMDTQEYLRRLNSDPVFAQEAARALDDAERARTRK